MAQTGLSVVQPRTLMPEAGEWQTMMQMAEVLVKSGLLPNHVRTPQAAVAIMLKGRELGIQAMYAMSNITVISGKPTTSAELMLALIYRDHGDNAITFEETTNERCTISYARRGWNVRKSYTFTIADARQAGVTGNQTWQKYPAAMLRARCISAVARLAFPDSIAGMYTPEELGATVDMDSEGQISIVAVDEPYQEIVQVQPSKSRREWMIEKATKLQAEALVMGVDGLPEPINFKTATDTQIEDYGKAIKAAMDAPVDDAPAGSTTPEELKW